MHTILKYNSEYSSSIVNVTQRTFDYFQDRSKNRDHANIIIGEQSEPHTYRTAEKNFRHIYIIGERSEPHTYRTVGKNLRHIYIYVFYIYIYIYTFVRRARAVHARATRKRRTGRLRFNGQYNRLKNGYFSSKL